MIKVRFLNNWGEDSASLLARYAAQTPGNNAIWGSIKGTASFKEADFYVVMDGIPHHLIKDIDWSRVVYFQREPESIRPLFMKHQFPEDIFFKGTYENFFNVPVWWINAGFNELAQMPYPKKTKKISSITSGKTGMREYNDRINFLNRFARRCDDLDIFGKGIGPFVGNKWKGELNYDGKCKLRGLIDYEYTISLENTMLENSWTEKLADSYLCWTLPIYSGDSKLHSYFPKESFYRIDVNSHDLEDVIEFISEPPSKIQIEALQEARNLLLFKWNLWPSIERIVSNVV